MYIILRARGALNGECALPTLEFSLAVVDQANRSAYLAKASTLSSLDAPPQHFPFLSMDVLSYNILVQFGIPVDYKMMATFQPLSRHMQALAKTGKPLSECRVRLCPGVNVTIYTPESWYELGGRNDAACGVCTINMAAPKKNAKDPMNKKRKTNKGAELNTEDESAESFVFTDGMAVYCRHVDQMQDGQISSRVGNGLFASAARGKRNSMAGAKFRVANGERSSVPFKPNETRAGGCILCSAVGACS
jgi:hypothetical protein